MLHGWRRDQAPTSALDDAPLRPRQLRGAGPPCRGDFHFQILLMPLSQKPVQKRFLSPEGVSLSVKAVLQKNFLVRESISLVAPASAAVTRLAA